MTLTVRKRTSGTPGQGSAVITKHICAQNCLKIVKASTDHVGRPGRKPGTKNGTKSQPTASTTRKTATKGGTKKSSAARTGKITSESSSEARARVIKDVRAITRTANGGWAKGHNYRTERTMIAEREKMISSK
jgi:hypothetical protein